MPAEPWRVSLHGGHSGQFCEHAKGELRDVLEAAVKAGYHTFGVSEHAPRLEDRFLYPSELEKGFTVARLLEDFESYTTTVEELRAEFAGRLVVLRGFEAEVVPGAGYRDTMLGYRSRYGFDYMVGSVHYVDEFSIDSESGQFRRLLDKSGGLEEVALRYYETVAEMVEALRPDVVGHLDLIRRHARAAGEARYRANPKCRDTSLGGRARLRFDSRPEYGRLSERPGNSLPGALVSPTRKPDGHRVLFRR